MMRPSFMRVTAGMLVITVLLLTVSLLFAQTGTWQTINTDNLPTARHETSFVQLGGKFYLIGGRESKVVQIYDPAANKWTDGATAPKTMHHIQPVVVDNLIYAVAAYSGSCCDDEFGLANNYIYDPVQNKWITGGAIPEARRRGGGGVVFYQGAFYIIGGLTGGHGMGNDGISANSRNWFDRWNPYTNTWQMLTNTPRDRDHFGAAVVGNKLYAISGRASEGASFFSQTIAPVDVYNFASGQWSTLPASANIPTQRAGTAVVGLGDEIFIIGGESGGQSTAHNQTEAFNPTTNTWRTLDTLNQGRHGTTATLCNDLVYIAAGSPVKGGGTLNSMERYYQSVASACPSATITPGQITASTNGGFGQVEVGSSLMRTITITHSSGNQGVIITGFAKTGSNDFSAVFPYQLPIVLAPGMSVDIEVVYTPSGTGTDTGTLAITRHNTSQALQVALSGEGINGVPATATPTQTRTATPTATSTVMPTSTTIPFNTATSTATATSFPESTGTAFTTETQTPVPFTDTPNAVTATSESLTATATVIATDSLPTSTPTSTSAGIELIENGDFEAKTEDQLPELAPWVLKNGLKDKIKCNRLGKPPIAYSGDCAFRFKGSITENAKLQQNIALVNLSFNTNDLLTLRAYLKTGSVVNGKIKVTVVYNDPLLARSKISVIFASTTEYTEISGSTLLASGDIATMKVKIAHKSADGKVYMDAISLQTTASTPRLLPVLP